MAPFDFKMKTGENMSQLGTIDENGFFCKDVEDDSEEDIIELDPDIEDDDDDEESDEEVTDEDEED